MFSWKEGTQNLGGLYRPFSGRPQLQSWVAWRCVADDIYEGVYEKGRLGGYGGIGRGCAVSPRW